MCFFMLQPCEFTKSFSFLYRLEGTRSNCGQTLYPKALFMLYVILSLQVMQCVAVDVTVLQLCWVLTCKTCMVHVHVSTSTFIRAVVC